MPHVVNKKELLLRFLLFLSNSSEIWRIFEIFKYLPLSFTVQTVFLPVLEATITVIMIYLHATIYVYYFKTYKNQFFHCQNG